MIGAESGREAAAVEARSHNSGEAVIGCRLLELGSFAEVLEADNSEEEPELGKFAEPLELGSFVGERRLRFGSSCNCSEVGEGARASGGWDTVAEVIAVQLGR